MTPSSSVPLTTSGDDAVSSPSMSPSRGHAMTPQTTTAPPTRQPHLRGPTATNHDDAGGAIVDDDDVHPSHDDESKSAMLSFIRWLRMIWQFAQKPLLRD